MRTVTLSGQDFIVNPLKGKDIKALKAQGKLPNLDESEEINACSIKIDVDVAGRKEPWLLMFKK